MENLEKGVLRQSLASKDNQKARMYQRRKIIFENCFQEASKENSISRRACNPW